MPQWDCDLRRGSPNSIWCEDRLFLVSKESLWGQYDAAHIIVILRRNSCVEYEHEQLNLDASVPAFDAEAEHT